MSNNSAILGHEAGSEFEGIIRGRNSREILRRGPQMLMIVLFSGKIMFSSQSAVADGPLHQNKNTQWITAPVSKLTAEEVVKRRISRRLMIDAIARIRDITDEANAKPSVPGPGQRNVVKSYFDQLWEINVSGANPQFEAAFKELIKTSKKAAPLLFQLDDQGRSTLSKADMDQLEDLAGQISRLRRKLIAIEDRYSSETEHLIKGIPEAPDFNATEIECRLVLEVRRLRLDAMMSAGKDLLPITQQWADDMQRANAAVDQAPLEETISNLFNSMNRYVDEASSVSLTNCPAGFRSGVERTTDTARRIVELLRRVKYARGDQLRELAKPCMNQMTVLVIEFERNYAEAAAAGKQFEQETNRLAALLDE